MGFGDQNKKKRKKEKEGRKEKGDARTIDDTTTVGITVGGVVDSTTTELAGLFDGEVRAVTLVEDSVCKGRS